MKKGIDLSGYNGKIDFEKVKNDNIDFVILKLGNIYNYSENYIDSRFKQYYEQATSVNIPIGIYVFNYATTQSAIKKGVQFIKRCIQNLEINMPIYLDMEDITLSKLGKERITQICKWYIEEMNKEGLRHGIYANLNWYNTYIDRDKLNTSIWIAQYYNECTYNKHYDIWQYSSKGNVKGINGNVDMNILYNDSIIQNNLKLKDDKTIVNEIILGKWGDGTTRKELLVEQRI